VIGWRASEQCEEGSDKCVERRGRRTFVARLRVPGKYLVEFFEINICEVIFEA
jgi:hypothetical protein